MNKQKKSRAFWMRQRSAGEIYQIDHLNSLSSVLIFLFIYLKRKVCISVLIPWEIKVVDIISRYIAINLSYTFMFITLLHGNYLYLKLVLTNKQCFTVVTQGYRNHYTICFIRTWLFIQSYRVFKEYNFDVIVKRGTFLLKYVTCRFT